MEFTDIESLVKQVIEEKHESQIIEIKAAKKGCPEKLYDTLSSFSNQDDGGTIIFGIDEEAGYALTGVYDAVKNLPAKRKTQVLSPAQEDPLEEGMETHSSILAWEIPWTRGAWQATVHRIEKSWTPLK